MVPQHRGLPHASSLRSGAVEPTPGLDNQALDRIETDLATLERVLERLDDLPPEQARLMVEGLDPADPADPAEPQT